MQTMDFDPMTLQTIHDAGFSILPRFSDRIKPYNQELTEALLVKMKGYGVTRVLFDGDKVKGASDQAEDNSLDKFGELLKNMIWALQRLKI